MVFAYKTVFYNVALHANTSHVVIAFAMCTLITEVVFYFRAALGKSTLKQNRKMRYLKITSVQ